jgi:hypothetical protein
VWVRGTLGVLACLVGAIWIAQGTNLLHGSGMSGHGEWTAWGVVSIGIGVALILWARAVRDRRYGKG